MNRTVICVLIMLLISGASAGAVIVTDRCTEEFISLTERAVEAEAGSSPEEVESILDELESYWKSRRGILSLVVRTDMIGEISCDIAKLRELYRHNADDFTAECKCIKARAELIRERQKP